MADRPSEVEGSADRPCGAPPNRLAGEADARPSALLVMAEYGVEDPVWARPTGHGGPVRLTDLGVTPQLVSRLRGWNEQFENLAATDFEWESPEVEDAWIREGLNLAYELQNQLPDIDISYAHDGDGRSVRERRGP